MGVIYGVVLSIVVNMGSSKIMPSLKEFMKNTPENEKIAILVHLAERPNYEAIKGLPPKEYVEFLKSFSENSQREILSYLNENFSDAISELRPYWIFNGFYVKATKEVIENLAERPDVGYIIEDFVIQIEDVVPADESGNIDAIEWGVLRVRADSCWMDGYDGTGVIIGQMDTGVDVNHPALSGKWEGHWYDGINGQANPYDDHGHGTHTMGTILGGDGFGSFTNDIGVAPGAQFVACKICNSGGSCPSSAIHAGFQKIAEWKGQGVNIVACSNSWGGSSGTTFWDDVMNWRNLGIIPVFSNGNSGPNPGTVGEPASFPTAIGVGATDSGDNIASFSSRGPAPNQNPWNDPQYWPRSDWNLIKPNISAPGVNIRSSTPGGGYGYMSGTSMACPHVAGGIAILYQKNATLDFTTVYSLLLDHAREVPQGSPYPNNDYGWGILNVYQSLLNTPTPNMPNVYVETHTLQDAGGNGVWDPGETAYITVTLRNTGVDANNVQAVLRTSSPHVTIQDSSSSFGNIPQGGTANNNSDPFVVVASSGAPSGTQVDFDVYITATGGYSNTSSFTETIGIPGVDWADHDCGNILVTVTRYGAIGFMGSNQSAGHGVQYPIGSTGRLFYGSFAVGTALPYVIDRYYESNQGDDDDWVTTSSPDGYVHMYEPSPPFDEYSVAIYDDSGGEQVKGITATQKGYAWSDANGDDFVILEFVLKNNGSQNVTGFYAGIFLDWDINTSTYADNGGTDATRNMAYQYYSGTYVGSAILNPMRGSAQIANVSMINNPTYVYPYAGLPDSIEIKFLDGTYSFPSAGSADDWSTCISAGPFDIPVGDSITVAYVIAGGTNLSNLQEHVDTAYNRYWNVSVAEKPVLRTKFVKVLPSVSKGEVYLNYVLPVNAKAEISVFNSAGARVKSISSSLERNENMKKISLKELPEGIYIINVKTPYTSSKDKIILVK